jgi:hypothetical protein
MSNSDNSGCFIFLLWLITIVISIGSGIISWNWIEPKSFIGAVIFLIIWGILSKIGHFIAIGIVALLSNIN